MPFNLFSRRPVPITPAARRPLPRTQREWLEALQFYDAARGIDTFLDRFDFGQATPHQLYFGILGRLPESAAVAMRPAGYSARQQCRDMLLCPEFRKDMITRVLHAYPDKRRLFFIHIPKCAGTDLATHLKERMPYLAITDVEWQHWAPDLLDRLREISQQLKNADRIATIGHFTLATHLSRELIRYGDECFAIVRDPVEIAVSNVNFLLTTQLSDVAERLPDIGDWLERQNLHKRPQDLDAVELKALALRYLRDPTITPLSVLCGFLGRGTADSALELCACADIELTTISRYDGWLRQRWGVVTESRANVSTKFLRPEDLSADDVEYLHSMTTDDRRFYERIERRLSEQGRLSIRGSEL